MDREDIVFYGVWFAFGCGLLWVMLGVLLPGVLLALARVARWMGLISLKDEFDFEHRMELFWDRVGLNKILPLLLLGSLWFVTLPIFVFKWIKGLFTKS